MSDGEQPRSQWPRYDERERERQEEHGWIVLEVRRLIDRVDGMKESIREDAQKTAKWRADVEGRLAVIERTHERDAAMRVWLGKILAGFWILVGAVAAKGLEWFLSHRPIVAAIGASAVMLSASGAANAAPQNDPVHVDGDVDGGVGTDVGSR